MSVWCPSRTVSVAGWLIASLCAGVWLGVAGRAAMRVVALEAGVNPEFSAGGSLEVVAFGVILGAPVALAVWGCRARWPLPSWTGVAIGVLLFSIMALVQPPAARSALAGTPDSPVLTAWLFGLAFVSYGAVLDALWHWTLARSRGDQ